MESGAIFAETSGVQGGSSIVYVLSALNTPLFFLGLQVPHFPHRTGSIAEYGPSFNKSSGVRAQTRKLFLSSIVYFEHPIKNLWCSSAIICTSA